MTEPRRFSCLKKKKKGLVVAVEKESLKRAVARASRVKRAAVPAVVAVAAADAGVPCGSKPSFCLSLVV